MPVPSNTHLQIPHRDKPSRLPSVTALTIKSHARSLCPRPRSYRRRSRTRKPTFARDILPATQPLLIKGLNAAWPAVEKARQSDEAIVDYLRAMDCGAPAQVLEANARSAAAASPMPPT